ncbi:hypothetical protein NFJ02_08g135930 [Pycnococcus provasolii]
MAGGKTTSWTTTTTAATQAAAEQQQPTTWTPLAGPSEAELSAVESERKLNETNARINAILERLQNVSLHRQEVDAKATVRSRDEEIKLTQERVAALTRERMAGTGVPPTPSLSEEKEEQTELEDEILRDFEHQDDVARERYLDAINANNGGEIMCSHERDRLDLTQPNTTTAPAPAPVQKQQQALPKKTTAPPPNTKPKPKPNEKKHDKEKLERPSTSHANAPSASAKPKQAAAGVVATAKVNNQKPKANNADKQPDKPAAKKQKTNKPPPAQQQQQQQLLKSRKWKKKKHKSSRHNKHGKHPRRRRDAQLHELIRHSTPEKYVWRVRYGVFGFHRFTPSCHVTISFVETMCNLLKAFGKKKFVTLMCNSIACRLGDAGFLERFDELRT